jgi:hypothetical protein
MDGDRRLVEKQGMPCVALPVTIFTVEVLVGIGYFDCFSDYEGMIDADVDYDW